MKKFKLVIPPHVVFTIRHLHPLIKSKIRQALEKIQEDPHLGKALNEPLQGLYSYRVSAYRIVYEIREEKIFIEVVDIGKRKHIYQNIIKKWKAII